VTSEERRVALETIASEIRVCDRCPLSQTRTQAVPGEGDPDTEVVLVGEGPGQREDQSGRPFVGAAGSLLAELLGMVEWTRDDVFITNVVKCRPPGNRDPEPSEIEACAPFLKRQLEVIDPALLVTLGRFSLQMFMPGDRIGRVHGTERPVDPATGARAATGYAMYHPAAALRQGSLKETMQRDVAAVPEALLRARGRRTDATASAPEPAAASAPEPIAVPAPRPGTDATPADPPTTDVTTAAAIDGTHPDPTNDEVPDDQLGLF
jgi:uracil-DNA glycosylase family 4